MSENSKIEWTDHTFNPWEGCQKVGPGCDHCYAEARNARFGGGTAINWGPGAERRRTSQANWNLPRRWNAQHQAFFNQHGRRQRVFCSSLADVFDNVVPVQWRIELMALILATPNLDWLLLTKRIANAAGMLEQAFRAVHAQREGWADNVPPHVWLGATIVNQAEADRDISKLLSAPAAKRFVSIEPLLGPVDLTRIALPSYAQGLHMVPAPYIDALAGYFDINASGQARLDWVIVGGESGPGARPMHPQWARSLREQCAAAGVPYLFKQWGDWAPRAGALTGGATDFSEIDPSCTRWPDVVRLGEHGLDTRAGKNCTDAMGEEVYMQRVGKKAAGRRLDGSEHHGFPI